MIVGYARVSTQDQNPQLQLDALGAAGCEQVFHEKATGVVRERPELTTCLRTLRKGDTLVVWKLDRLARSLKDLVEIVHDLNSRQVGFKSITESSSRIRLCSNSASAPKMWKTSRPPELVVSSALSLAWPRRAHAAARAAASRS